jgi:hypothetical protein
MNSMLPESMKHFSQASQQEILREDKAFILKIMKHDPRDRPTAE